MDHEPAVDNALIAHRVSYRNFIALTIDTVGVRLHAQDTLIVTPNSTLQLRSSYFRTVFIQHSILTPMVLQN